MTDRELTNLLFDEVKTMIVWDTYKEDGHIITKFYAKYDEELLLTVLEDQKHSVYNENAKIKLNKSAKDYIHAYIDTPIINR